MDWASERESLAENFAGRAQSTSSYIHSSRASRRFREEGDETNQEIQEFKEEIENRFLFSVANKFYSFPFTELTFDNPHEDGQIRDLVGRTVYSLYNPPSQGGPEDSIEDNKEQSGQEESAGKLLLNLIKNDRQKCASVIQLISSHRHAKAQERTSKSKEKKMAQKYGIIRQEDEQLQRKRIYTEPYEKHTGFIVKKK